MKRTVSALLLVILVFSAVLPAFAQVARSSGVPVITEDLVRFERITALSEGQGVFIRWATTSETGNFGFNVYRQGDDGLQVVNHYLIPGAAAKGGRETLTDGEYEWFDADGALNSIYVIRSMGRDGRSASSDPVGVTYTPDIESETERSISSIQTIGRPNSNVERQELRPSQELSDIIQANVIPPDIDTHRWVVSQPGAKIGVKREGLCRVSRSQLAAAGFDVNSNSANWRLFLEGVEQAIIVDPSGQYIEFYGKGIDRAESDTRIYYLISGVVEGSRMTTKILRSIGGTVVSRNSRVLAEKKERMFYLATVKNGDVENYWGSLITGTPPLPGQEISFNVTGIDYSMLRCLITVKLQGIQGANHLVRVKLNGFDIGTVGGPGNTSYSEQLVVSTGRLVEGTNLLALNETTSGRASYFDSVTVDFARKYHADQNKVSFATPGYRKIDLTGFTTPNIRLFETTYDGNPIQISGHTIESNGGVHTVKIPSGRPMLMYGIEDTAFLQPAGVTENIPSTLSTTTNEADLVIISYSTPDFMAAAQTWASYRASPGGGGLNVKVVDVVDVFDEFNYGVHGADAINNFLEYAVNFWETRPQYVLLLGDASYDPRNYEGWGNFNYVPTKMLDLLFDESGSDEALADFNEDGLAELAIGRIPARTAAVITTAFNKTTGFETPANQSLDRGALFAYDLPLGYDFQYMSQQLRDQLPPTMPATFVSRGLPPPNQNVPDPAAQANLINAINTGKYIVNYSGHGSAGIWASTNFFSNANVPQLTNGANQSIFTMLTCLNGYFVRPLDSDSCIAERLLKLETGGAVATWASSTATFPNLQQVMAVRFYDQLGDGNITRMGDLIRDAKLAIPFGRDVLLSWVLLGDPTLQVRPATIASY